MSTNGVGQRSGLRIGALPLRRGLVFAVTAVGALLLSCCLAHGMECGDEIWMIGTRHLGNRPRQTCLCQTHLCYQKYLPCLGWVCASEAQYFCEQPPCGVTIVYVHGNRIRQEDACAQGMLLYRRLRCCCPAGVPIRFVIWSWPSSPIPASLCIGRDARVKYRRTDPQAFVLARWLTQVSPETNLTLIGYSFGARLVLGALHLLGGGCLDGCRLPCSPACLPCTNVALWAAATENSWLTPGGCHACALRVIHCGLITVNRVDPVLRRFRRVILRTRQRALGQTGLRGMCGCDPGQFCHLNVTPFVGRRHEWERYCCSNAVIWHTARVALSCCCCATDASPPPGDQQ